MTISLLLLLATLPFSLWQNTPTTPVKGPLGIFEAASDVGKDLRPGTATYDAEKDEYRMTGGGANMWGNNDGFHFAYNRVSGDKLKLMARVRLFPSDGDPHRKAGLMIRESLEPDSPYVDAVIHADGLTSLQYRETKGGETREVKAQTPTKGPFRLILGRDGTRFTLWIESTDAKPTEAGSVEVKLPTSAYAGLVVCAHNAAKLEMAEFREVRMER
ncbi:MAG: hypothetical protein EHM61_16405 [Acidobacteria bacterium]|nr:MAG: hypothetical protein EHM61_16405 [Acidobacteriota bacterium]